MRARRHAGHLENDEDALTFGAYLRQSRVLRELSLDEVATATKLPRRVVAALEADELRDRHHALLVARACAGAIGLDPEETALRLEEEFQRVLGEPRGARPRLWKRLWRARPREAAVWIVVGITVLVCIALLFRGR
ncbi:MAG: helix-turn-helix domain-containing protein [Myxococcales bacterium]|nr:helix-turn-helix domain-containing protein [Myxococcales bacterium]